MTDTSTQEAADKFGSEAMDFVTNTLIPSIKDRLKERFPDSDDADKVFALTASYAVFDFLQAHPEQANNFARLITNSISTGMMQ